MGSATTSNWRSRRFGGTSTSRAVWPCWTAETRTTPSAARPSYPLVTGTPPGARCGVSHDCSWGTEGLVGFYEKGQLVHSWKSTRGVRQGMVLGPVLFSIRHHRHPPPTGKAAFSNASFTAYLDDVTVAAPPGHAWEGVRGDLPGDACPGHRDKQGQDGGPQQRRASAHGPAEHNPAVCPRARCGSCKRPRERADYAVFATQGRGNDRLFRAIVELPFAKHTQWQLLSVSALPRVTFLLRTHAPTHTRAAVEWFDYRVTGVLGVIMDGPVTKRARDMAAMPVRRGGCGLRRQREIAEFALRVNWRRRGSNTP
ncbi:hypothetical protein TcBrA4_0050340 [Trypanosoma cruzi]|nr:hypothetical protein TcBrA4_0050340 [Trypanosoma cruzi]